MRLDIYRRHELIASGVTLEDVVRHFDVTPHMIGYGLDAFGRCSLENGLTFVIEGDTSPATRPTLIPVERG